MKINQLFLIASFVLLTATTGFAAVLRVPAAYPTIQEGLDAAVTGDLVLVADGIYTGEHNRNLRIGRKTITVASEHGPQSCIIDPEWQDRGFYLFEPLYTPDSVIRGFTIRHGAKPSDARGGAFYCDGGYPTIADCILNNNAANSGAAILCEIASPIIFNCLIANNLGGAAVAIYDQAWQAISSAPIIAECTITNNPTGIAYSSGLPRPNPRIINSIIWGNTDYDFQNSFDPTRVTFCDIGGGHPVGEGNISADPLFVTGLFGAYYLSQVAAGQTADSPCLNAGNNWAEAICLNIPDRPLCMGALTNRTDQVNDSGLVDMGFHYTPAKSVTLQLSQELFRPGDAFLLTARITNLGPTAVTSIPFVVLLDVFGAHYWYPLWSGDFTYAPLDLGIATVTREILQFTWPDEPSAASGVMVYGALLNQGLTGIWGSWDRVEFGWQP